MTLRLRPLFWSGVATASISYGPTAALGKTSSTVVCGTECVVTILVTLTQAVYWRANYSRSAKDNRVRPGSKYRFLSQAVSGNRASGSDG